MLPWVMLLKWIIAYIYGWYHIRFAIIYLLQFDSFTSCLIVTICWSWRFHWLFVWCYNYSVHCWEVGFQNVAMGYWPAEFKFCLNCSTDHLGVSEFLRVVCWHTDLIVYFSLFETELPEVASRLKTVLADSKGTLKKLKFPGAQILLKKLTS